MTVNLVGDPLAIERFFLGAPDSPFLAPRGLAWHNDILVVADTGQNRVFVWYPVPEGTVAEPLLVLGQTESAATGRNQGHGVDACSLQYPSGVWTDGQRLAIADAWNHRVLLWHTFPTRSGQPADVVVGQPDFQQNAPNVAGVGQPPTARSLYWPYGVMGVDNQLWIADTGNRRVLYFAEWPQTHYQPADRVLGKPSFTERDYDQQDAVWPYSVRLGPQGQLAIADTQYYRILGWNHWERAFQEPAHWIIGQKNLEDGGLNQYGLFPQAHTLSWCYDCCFDDNKLWVADTGNSRILQFQPIPHSSNAAATAVLGKPDFQTGSENLATIFGTTETLYWPFALARQGSQLAAADTGNHRIAFFRP